MNEDPDGILHSVLSASVQRNTLPQPLILVLTLCLSALAILGVAGNILVVAFFHRNLQDLPQNTYVIALASLDLIICSVVIPSTLYQDVWRESSSDLSCKAFHMLRCSLIIASAFLLCLIAIDRFVIICFVPGIQTSRRKSCMLIGLVLGLGFVIGSPLGLTTGTRHFVSINVDGAATASPRRLPITLRQCTSDFTIISRATAQIYKTGLTVLFLLLLLLIVFFYANIFAFVRQRRIRWSKSRSSAQKSARSASRMVESRRKSSTRLDDTCIEVVNSCAPRSAVLETDIDEAIANSNIEEAADPAGEAMLRLPSAIEVTQRRISERRRKKPHIKTAKVLSIITFFYLLSYLPFFLVFHLHDASSAFNRNIGQVVGGVQTIPQAAVDDGEAASAINSTTDATGEDLADNIYHGNATQETGTSAAASLGGLLTQTLFYFYFINHGVNPIIYGCMNTYFKQQVYVFCNSMRAPCRRPQPIGTVG